jgi:spore germination cell wall hydrolase CwlJ-like protein
MEQIIKATTLAISLVLAIALVQEVTEHKLGQLAHAQALDTPEIVTAKERERQLECLTINIYREAGYESFEGKVGVAQVTMNRVNSSDFPNDVCAVVYQKTKFTGRVVCQFSWYCDSKHRNRPLGPGHEESYEVAKRVLLEDFRLPGLDDALYYHADYVHPRWKKLERIQQIGTHIFYKPREKG